MDKARLSALYHLSREQHYDWIDKSLSALTSIAATLSVGLLLKKAGDDWELVVSAITAALALIAIIAQPGAAARKHARLAADNRSVVAAGEQAGEHWSTSQADQFAARLAEIEVEEGHVRPVVVAICENQLALARSSEEHKVTAIQLRWYERRFRHWVDFDIEAIRQRSEPSATPT